MDSKDYKPGLIKSRDVCRLLSICSRTLKDYIADGRIRAYRLPGNHFRFRHADVLGLLQVGEGDPGPFEDTWSAGERGDTHRPMDRVAAGTRMPQGSAQEGRV